VPAPTAAPLTAPPRSRRLTIGVLAALLVLGGAACGDDGTDDRTDGGAVTSSPGGGTPGPDDRATDGPGPAVGSVTATEVAVLDEPIMLLPRPGDDHVWVAERAGLVRRLKVDDDGSLTPAGEPVLDLTDQTTTDMERGLLGLAFSADGATLYVSHTDPDGTSIVAAYDVADSDDGPTVDAGSRQVLLTQEQPYPNHNGGHLLLDGDGQLWFGLGDGGAADDPENNAQDPDTLLGKLLRIDLTGDEEHEIVALGLRNPWRFAIDSQDQVMWIADVGQNAIEEVNRTPLADLDGANFGWSGYEGAEPYLDGDGRRPADPVMPVFTYRHDGDPGGCSVTGGVVYRGTELPGLDGAYLISDYCGGWVQALLTDDQGAVTAVDLGLDVPGPVSFGSDADGHVYVLSAEGPVLRIDPA
jgi:glucose/arabinose dehydrogenase